MRRLIALMLLPLAACVAQYPYGPYAYAPYQTPYPSQPPGAPLSAPYGYQPPPYSAAPPAGQLASPYAASPYAASPPDYPAPSPSYGSGPPTAPYPATPGNDSPTPLTPQPPASYPATPSAESYSPTDTPPTDTQPTGPNQAYPPTVGPYGAVNPTPTSADTLEAPMLQAQNAVRAQVGDPPLAWSPTLAAAAQVWADHLIATGAFAHRPDNPYGENLYAIVGGTVSPEQVVASWAGEARGYDPRGNSCNGVCGHYTQIVWRATRQVGCAMVSNGQREVWDCEYSPPGNVIGYRPY